MSGDPLELLRDDLRDFGGYKSARSEPLYGDVWLNANESPWDNPADPGGQVRRYPQPQPQALRAQLAQLYGVAADQLLLGRGSDEGIDLLVRAFCQAGRDAILTTPPVFGMYAVSARLQAARVIEVPLHDGDDDFQVDLEQVARQALAAPVKLVFLCSPGNPAGGVLAREAVLELAGQLQGRALLVVDEAYVEYADTVSLAADIAAHANLVVLRTLSKAYALAAARVGAVLADARVIAALQRCQAPYPLPAPCSALAEAALVPQALQQTRLRIDLVRTQRAWLAAQLQALPQVRRVYPSQGNFLLVRWHDPEAAFRRLLDAGVVVRDQRAAPQLRDALRISIGTPEQNAAVIAALRTLEAAA